MASTQRIQEYESLSTPLLNEKDGNHTTDHKGSQTTLGRANFLSRWTFSWINPLLKLGYSRPLVLEDIPTLLPEDDAFIAYETFAAKWDKLRKECNTHETNAGNLIINVMTKVFAKDMIIVGLCALLRTIAVVVSPLVLYAFVQYSNCLDKDLNQGLILVGWLLVMKGIECVGQRHWFFNSRRSGMRMRSALMVAIYKKQLNLSSLGKRRHSTGEIVNYIAVDAYRMGEAFWLWCASGLVPLFIVVLFNVPMARIYNNCLSKFMAAQDERLRATSEILNNMKIIKLQSWEEKFKNVIDSLREKEFKWLAETQIKKSYSTILYWFAPTIISIAVFIGCVILQTAPLNAANIFMILAMLRNMQEPVRTIPESISTLIQVRVSLDRIGTFLLDDEFCEKMRVPMINSDISIRIQGGTFSWVPESAIPAVKDMNLEVKRGQTVAVCGPVGAGKSSLLHAILGEAPKISGSVNVIGSIAYVSQAPWIQSGTIRDNVLFGKPMNRIKYLEAIKACALDKDLKSFNHGDLTEIGQRGLNLSGGQKQRIQLARAVYDDADIYLLDDPFSAVDAHTAAVLFNGCVVAALQDKTVILVTHQVEFLNKADKILVMEGGQVTQLGSYEELLTSGTVFEQLVNAHNDAVLSSNNENQGESKKLEADQLCEPYKSHSIQENTEKELSVEGIPGIQLTKEEDTAMGNVGWRPFLDYINISKGHFFLAAATYWLAIAIEIPKINYATLIGVYAGLSTLSTLFVFLRTLFSAYLGLKASRAFFLGFMNSVIKAPMLFFDSTPIGRIFTRVSSDMSILDFDIPFAIAYYVSCVIDMLAIIGIMASVTWPVLIVAAPAIIAATYAQRYYLSSARELMRINGVTKAPIMNYAAESSLGVVTIRAFNMTGQFFRNYLKLVDTDARLFFHSNTAMEWLLLRVETLQNLTLITNALLLVLLPQGYLDSGLMGLSLSYALTLSTVQVIMSRWYCNLANYIISVERIKQFMDIPPEPPAIVDDVRPPPSWPSHGRIELHDLKIRYRPNAPLVLKGITCTFNEGRRVGVVGRTGSGKSTLISALFRLVEPESGRILIDGLDICSMGLKDLRSKLSIIPQDPTLFRGSIRSNLDPLGLYSDTEIWEALSKCQLKDTVSSQPNLLDSVVSDEGENWSVGQRQLLCLGRVLLKRNKILVLDEATASIDTATDAIVQTIIRQEFPSCTVITVAHRVPTVTNSDKVMVLSFGETVEYDEPSKLMQTNSFFSRLVEEYWSSCGRNSIQGFGNF
ncbi:ABC transporter C family member 8 [Camellia lanceoleosa]|uniref:ABC transporter C family member 8 n=1 Tax=Camellia lanceoleosa TaxID=1840588 RepID=A0ACC0HNX7_9ERIC|nr:ABC transporter C family member 8 [Camellia lanceoleosa]